MWKKVSDLEIGETALIGSFDKVTVETIQVFETGTIVNGQVYLPHRCAYVVS